MRTIIIFGASGFIGKKLIQLLKSDFKIIAVSRRRKSGNSVEWVRMRRNEYHFLLPHFEAAEGIINLAGENVGSRWTEEKKAAIRESRLDIDATIVQAFKACTNKPKFLFQGSSMGVYGYSRTDKVIREKDPLGRHGFLTRVSQEHESLFQQLENQTRVIYLRTGLVLGNEGGAFPKLSTAFKYYVGGKLGNGKQWNSWIHIDDEIAAIRFLIDHKDASGAFNLTAPNPVQQKELARTMGKVLGKPSFIPAPAFMLRMLLGEMSREMLLSGLNIIPQRLLDEGFKFQYELVEEALKDLHEKQ